MTWKVLGLCSSQAVSFLHGDVCLIRISFTAPHKNPPNSAFLLPPDARVEKFSNLPQVLPALK